MDSRRGPALALLVAVLAFPASAQAAVRCVPASGPGCASSHATIAGAVGAASNDDTIRIAAGTYGESVSTTKRLSFVGAGVSATTIAPSSGSALTLARGGSVSGLRAVGADGWSGATAIVLQPDVDGSFSYSLSDVIGAGGDAADYTFGIGGAGLSAYSSSAARVVSLSLSGDSFSAGSSPGIFQGTALSLIGRGLTATITSTSATGPAAAGGDGIAVGGGSTVDATGLHASGYGAAQLADSSVTLRRSVLEGVAAGVAVHDFLSATPTTVNLLDDLITAAPVSAVNATALSVNADGAPAAVNVRGSTILARGVDPQYAVVARPALGSPSATIDLRNSIARLEGGAEAGEADVAADRGAVSMSSSDVASHLELNGGTIGGLTSSILSADPLFDPGAFTLRSSSPLVDRGDPAYVTAGERDLAGNPRVAGMAPDIGAFEFQPPVAPPPPAPPPNEAPKLGRVSMSNTVFAPVAGKGAACAAGRAGCSANGAASPRRARGRVKRGTIFRYVLSEPAAVTIAVERRARGVRARARARGRVRCVALTHKRARGKQKGKPCTRWLRSGTLKALQQAGSQSTPFGGRFKGRALKPGSYRARVVASDGRARSRERRLPFRIVRAR
jgi:hypothetical protein